MQSFREAGFLAITTERAPCPTSLVMGFGATPVVARERGEAQLMVRFLAPNGPVAHTEDELLRMLDIEAVGPGRRPMARGRDGRAWAGERR